MAEEGGPPLLRPIPRRPFQQNVISATPPDSENASEDGQDDPSESQGTESENDAATDASPASRFVSAKNLSELYNIFAPRGTAAKLENALAEGDQSMNWGSDAISRPSSHFLGIHTPSDGNAISRPDSFRNLSTLFGIYGNDNPAAKQDRFLTESDIDTPLGADVHTPVRRASVDDATYELMRERSHMKRRRSSQQSVDTTVSHSQPGPWADVSVFSIAVRGAALFALGVGYSVLLARFQDRTQWPIRHVLPEDSTRPGTDWVSMLTWGVGGVVLGCLMPWADKIWGDMLGDDKHEMLALGLDPSDPATRDARNTMYGALALRPIGAFVGIIFAIRKLAWTSTMQVSIYLVGASPCLWWLIDRSVVGLLLSTAVGVVGSLFFLSVNPAIIPGPPAYLNSLRGTMSEAGAMFNESMAEPALMMNASASATYAGIASQETIELGIWMLSVLSCSCLCFGNVGRRLAWDRPSGARGRWAGVR